MRLTKWSQINMYFVGRYPTGPDGRSGIWIGVPTGHSAKRPPGRPGRYRCGNGNLNFCYPCRGANAASGGVEIFGRRRPHHELHGQVTAFRSSPVLFWRDGSSLTCAFPRQRSPSGDGIAAMSGGGFRSVSAFAAPGRSSERRRHGPFRGVDSGNSRPNCDGRADEKLESAGFCCQVPANPALHC